MMKFLIGLEVVISKLTLFRLIKATNIFQFFKYDMTISIQFLFCKLLQVFRKIYFQKDVAKVIKNIRDLDFFSKVLCSKKDSPARKPSGDFFCSFETYTRFHQLSQSS